MMNLSTTWFPTEIKYDTLPIEMRSAMKLYVEQGILPESFPQAVIQNDFAMVAAHAHPSIVGRFRDIALFMLNYMPVEAWGSREKMMSWRLRGGAVGR